MTTDRQQQDLLFKPLIIAGLVIVTFSLVCLWIAYMALPQQESEGFKIIGYRFLIGGIISIVIGFVSKHYSLLYNYSRFYWNQLPFRIGRKNTNKFSDWYRP
jgi:multisubunit Na+/H+ antiporter MnhB subunit